MAAPAAAGAAAKAATVAKKLAVSQAMRGRRQKQNGSGGSGMGTKLLMLFAVIGSSMIVGVVLLMGMLSGVAQSQCEGSTPADLQGVSADGARPFLEIYADAAAVYNVNPFLLMAVHEDETNYGRSTLPGVTNGVNSAGCCSGPMQFYIGSGGSPSQGGRGMTWEGYRTAYQKAKLRRPANYPNRFAAPGYPTPNVYDSYDAIYAAAMYFSGLGAGPKLDQKTYEALLAYKGTPPASIPYAQHDYNRAREMERSARVQGGRRVAAVEDTGTGIEIADKALSLLGVAATKKALDQPSGTGMEELIMPVSGPVVSPFGQRWGRLHAGIDIAVPSGTPIKAAASGIITLQGQVSGYGNYTCIRHSAGLSTCYAHQSAFGRFRQGNAISQGEVLGYVGCTGHCYGDHLHFETRTGPSSNSTPVDPMGYLGSQVSANGEGGSPAGAVCVNPSAVPSGEGKYAWPVDGGSVGQGSNSSGTHSPKAAPNNWQSDNALDISVSYGTRVYAAEDGKIMGPPDTGFGDTGEGGATAGIRFTLDVGDNRIFYHHLSRLEKGIKPGASVRRGQLVGWSGRANGVDHLHIAVEHGRPEELFGLEGGTANLDAGSSIAYVGDSLGVGTVPYLKSAMPKVKIYDDVVVGRGSLDGVAALAKLMAERSGYDAVVFDLGTNDGSASMLRSSLRSAHDLAKGRPLVIATLNGASANASVTRAKNDVIEDFASRSGVIVVKWAEYWKGKGIHATGAGYDHRADMFAGALR